MLGSLIKREIKANYKIFIIFVMILSLYCSIIVAMYDPKLGESLNMMAQSMPELFAAFGMTNPGVTLMDFLINYLYGFILIIIPFIWTLILCQRLIVRYVDKGSMSYLLTTPHSRKQIILTQYTSLLLGVFALLIYAVILIYVCSYIMFEENLDIGAYLTLNFGLLALHIFFASLIYLTSCFFNESKYAIGVGGGLTFVFVLIQMLSQVNDKIEFLKYFTPMTLFDPQGLIGYETNALLCVGVFVILSIVLTCLGTMIFQKKDLFL